MRRILRIKFALGLFDRPYVREPGGIDAAAAKQGRDLAREAAEKSFVLLENRNVNGAPLLPLAAAPGRRIALIGPLADSAEDMMGSWPGAADSRGAVTLMAALAERLGRAGMQLSFAPGTTDTGDSDSGFAGAVEAARGADVVLMALGESSHSSGEASARSTLGLQGNQERLLEAVVATGRPVVLVVFSGRPLAITWASRHVPAILQAWFPGFEAGPALVRILFGDDDPAGRLTVSFPRSVGQEPLYYNTLNTGRPRSDPIGLGSTKAVPYYVTGYIDEKNTPLYPFGYGLAYTSFSYSTVSVDAPSISAAAVNRGDARLTVTAVIRNTGTRPGTETAQLYIRLRGTSVARPVRELKGFERVRLSAGESRRVQFTLGREELSFWNIDMKDVAEPGSLYVWVAPDSTRGDPAKVEITQ